MATYGHWRAERAKVVGKPQRAKKAGFGQNSKFSRMCRKSPIYPQKRTCRDIRHARYKVSYFRVQCHSAGNINSTPRQVLRGLRGPLGPPERFLGKSQCCLVRKFGAPGKRPFYPARRRLGTYKFLENSKASEGNPILLPRRPRYPAENL